MYIYSSSVIFDFHLFPSIFQEWHKLSDMEVNTDEQMAVPIFTVFVQGEKKLTLECKDVEATQQWVESLNEAIAKCKSSEKDQRQRKWESRSRSTISNNRNSTLGRKSHSTLNAKQAEELKAMATRAKSMAQNEAKYKTVGGIPSAPPPDSALFSAIGDVPVAPPPISSSSTSLKKRDSIHKRGSTTGSGKFGSGKGPSSRPAMPAMGDMMSEMMARRATLRKTTQS
jgi:hypothetical protein